MKVLIVDDSKAMRGIVKRTLQQAGFEFPTEEASNGAEALAKIRAAPPDLVLSDWNMPGMSGIELLAAIRAEGLQARNGFRVGFVTSESSPEMRKLAEDTGAAFLVAKPFTAAGIRSAIEGCLDPQRLGGAGAPRKDNAPAGGTNGFQLVDAKGVARLLVLLTGKAISARDGIPMRESEKKVTAIYQNESSGVVGTCVCTLELGTRLAAVLTNVQPTLAADAAREGVLDDQLNGNLRETFNVLSTAFGNGPGGHLRLTSVLMPGAPLPSEAQKPPQQRTSFVVTVPGYGAGQMDLCLH